MSGKTATERLREMLDERGVEWQETINHANCVFTWWESPIFGMVHAMDNEDGETLFMACLNNIDFTPEQAVTATLGSEFNPDGLPVGLTISDDSNLLNWRGENYVKQSTLGSGTLTANDVLNAVYKHGARWQAIADELNATLGGGECKWVWVESWTDTTDGRECDYAHWMPDCGCWSEGDYRFSDFDDYEEKPTGIVFCERCGKAVKR